VAVSWSGAVEALLPTLIKELNDAVRSAVAEIAMLVHRHRACG